MKRLLLICCILSLGSLSCFANPLMIKGVATINLHNSGKGIILVNQNALHPGGNIVFNVPALYRCLFTYKQPKKIETVATWLTLSFFQSEKKRAFSFKNFILVHPPKKKFNRILIAHRQGKQLVSISQQGGFDIGPPYTHGYFNLHVSSIHLPLVRTKKVTVLNTLDVPLRLTLDKTPKVLLNHDSSVDFPNATISYHVENRIATNLHLNCNIPINVVCPYVKKEPYRIKPIALKYDKNKKTWQPTTTHALGVWDSKTKQIDDIKKVVVQLTPIGKSPLLPGLDNPLPASFKLSIRPTKKGNNFMDSTSSAL